MDAGGFVAGGLQEGVGGGEGIFVNEGVVKEVESLGGNGGGAAVRGGGIGVGTVEEGKERVAFDALDHEVDRALAVVVDGGEGIMLGEGP